MIIVDGSSMLMRCLHTPLLNLTTSNGQFKTGGIFGFINSLSLSVKSLKSEHGVFVAWDQGGSAKRKKIFPAYKEGRTDTDPTGTAVIPEDQIRYEALYFSRKWLHSEILPRLGCISVLIREVEGDDIISWMCRHGPRDSRRLIVSCDGDMLQLVDDDTDWFDPQREKFHNKASFVAEHKLNPEFYAQHFIHTKALTGDGDFPGLGSRAGFEGLGPVTARKLSNAYLLGEDISTMKLGKEVLEHKDIWDQNILLADLVTPDPVLDEQIREYVMKSIQLDMSDKENELGAIFDRFELVHSKGKLDNISEANFVSNIRTVLYEHFYS